MAQWAVQLQVWLIDEQLAGGIYSTGDSASQMVGCATVELYPFLTGYEKIEGW